jgi:hypothetical protein
MNRRDLLQSALVSTAAAAFPTSAFTELQALSSAISDRSLWLKHLERLAYPILDALSRHNLLATMPVETAPGHEADRRRVTHLEALGRTLSGIAPWLENGPNTGSEATLRARYADLARASIAAAVDPKSPDALRFAPDLTHPEDRQILVDAAFLSLAILRAPHQLRDRLPATTRTQLTQALRATRTILPPYNNWLLFAALVEACLCQLGDPTWDRLRVDYALRSHQSWFLGDGTYGDGPHFHADYYNSIVIHPFLIALTEALAPEMAAEPTWSAMLAPIRARAARYAAIQERTIAPDGAYPIIGRSIAYRCGVFHHLADTALRRQLPEPITPAQVRGALTAIIRRTLEPAGTYDAKGWLQIGLAGHQPALGETYISTGSLYLASNVFLPLGLPPEDPFWSAPSTPWTSQQLWQGANLPADHAQNA